MVAVTAMSRSPSLSLGPGQKLPSAQAASRTCSTAAVHKQRHSGIHPSVKQQTQQQHHVSQTQRLQRAGGSAQQRDIPMCIPPSASAQHANLATASSTDRRQLLMGGVGGFVAASCQCCRLSPAQANEWAYGDVTVNISVIGPSMWSGVCATGESQSPINIPLNSMTLQPDSNDFKFSYALCQGPEVFNPGHGTMQVNLPAGNIARIGDRRLELLQFHFHTPSEHAIDGRRFPMEVHLVHRDMDSGGLAVLGVLIQPGGIALNPAIQLALDYASTTPLVKVRAKRSLDVSALLPKRSAQQYRPFVHYVGSLTTPPCSESVDWFLLTKPINVPDTQILQFLRFAGGGSTFALNARPLQPINGRQLTYEL